jgi:ureidoacrylate peracid hydrolase
MNLTDKVNPLTTALVVIDIQNDFCSSKGVLAKRGRDLSLMDPMIDTLEDFIETARNKNVLTLYTQQIFDRSHLNPLQLEQYDLDNKLVTCDISGDGYGFYRLNPPVDSVYVKYNFNAFSNPDFQRILEKRGIKTLVITGVDAQFCVETAIRNGFDLGYKIVVPSDLIATNAKKVEVMNRTLDLVRSTYGVVTTSIELESIWNTYEI